MSDSEAEGDEEEAAPRWRPTPSRQATLTPGHMKPVEKDLPPTPQDASAASGSPDQGRKRRKIPAPKAPELKVLPEMLPLFVEMVRPLLRPARTASASSLRSNSYDPYAVQGGRSRQLPASQMSEDRLASSMQDMDLAATLSPTSYASPPFAAPRNEFGQSRQEPRGDRLPGEYKW